MSLKENVVMRLIGLFIFVAPGHGAAFLADVHIKTSERVSEMKRDAKGRSLAS